MKVLDLQCGLGHSFEGWFASEADFVAQCNRSMVQCPLCGHSDVVKKLSAPRLMLRARAEPPAGPPMVAAVPQPDHESGGAWLQLARSILSNTEDVGERFADLARKMHYGETEARAIRGKTTWSEAHSLAEEGIDVIPLPIPESLKNPLQ
jgi:hypothetical protein